MLGLGMYFSFSSQVTPKSWVIGGAERLDTMSKTLVIPMMKDNKGDMNRTLYED